MKDKIKELASKNRYSVEDLLTIMAILRSENGCPWDREQTHQSIRNNLIEEAYEAVEAIDTHDTDLLREELGDILLQVVFHSRIASEKGIFDFADVASDICAKLIERHPHIFADVVADTSAQVLINWEQIKQRSKQREKTSAVLDGIAKSLPSLMRAGKLAKKAVKAGIEIKADDTLTEEQVGKALFELAACAELNQINPEQALYNYCEKFILGIKRAETE